MAPISNRRRCITSMCCFLSLVVRCWIGARVRVVQNNTSVTRTVVVEGMSDDGKRTWVHGLGLGPASVVKNRIEVIAALELFIHHPFGDENRQVGRWVKMS